MSRLGAVILLLALVCILQAEPVRGGLAVMHEGDIEGVPFRIQIPGEWNRCLVMYAHGYKPRGGTWTPLADMFSEVFLERGFAVAESGYSRQGWAVEEALAETEALRRYFSDQYGRPDSTFVTGHSMGGLIALATIEAYPEAYDGALPMCGPLAPALFFFKDHVFDMLVTFEAFFGEYIPQELRPVIDAAGLPAGAVEQALASDSVRAAGFAAHWGVKRAEVPGIVSLYHLLYTELADRAGGNPIDNCNSVYSGLEPIRGLNALVPRYEAAPEALAYLRRFYTPTGEIEDPVLAVHTTYDAGVPPSVPDLYNMIVDLEGTGEWFVQMYVEADGHCNIAPAFVGRAFDRLRAWAARGIRPEPGILE
jgi:pimeloyl-ACP methyl ester carboxylesterase